MSKLLSIPFNHIKLPRWPFYWQYARFFLFFALIFRFGLARSATASETLSCGYQCIIPVVAYHQYGVNSNVIGTWPVAPPPGLNDQCGVLGGAPYSTFSLAGHTTRHYAAAKLAWNGLTWSVYSMLNSINNVIDTYYPLFDDHIQSGIDSFSLTTTQWLNWANAKYPNGCSDLCTGDSCYSNRPSGNSLGKPESCAEKQGP